MTRITFAMPALAIIATIGCSNDTMDQGRESPQQAFTDLFTSGTSDTGGTSALTLSGQATGDDAVDFIVTVDLNDVVAGASQAVSYDTRGPTDAEMHALYNLMKAAPALALEAQRQLGQRAEPGTPQASAWLALERKIVGMAIRSHVSHVESAGHDSVQLEADSCGPFGRCKWEFCPEDGYDHCCCFDQGCGWLCRILN